MNMKRKLAFGRPSIVSLADTDGDDALPDDDSPAYNHLRAGRPPQLDLKTETELRRACALILRELKPSGHDLEDTRMETDILVDRDVLEGKDNAYGLDRMSSAQRRSTAPWMAEKYVYKKTWPLPATAKIQDRTSSMKSQDRSLFNNGKQRSLATKSQEGSSSMKSTDAPKPIPEKSRKGSLAHAAAEYFAPSSHRSAVPPVKIAPSRDASEREQALSVQRQREVSRTSSLNLSTLSDGRQRSTSFTSAVIIPAVTSQRSSANGMMNGKISSKETSNQTITTIYKNGGGNERPKSLLAILPRALGANLEAHAVPFSHHRTASMVSMTPDRISPDPIPKTRQQGIKQSLYALSNGLAGTHVEATSQSERTTAASSSVIGQQNGIATLYTTSEVDEHRPSSLSPALVPQPKNPKRYSLEENDPKNPNRYSLDNEMNARSRSASIAQVAVLAGVVPPQPLNFNPIEDESPGSNSSPTTYLAPTTSLTAATVRPNIYDNVADQEWAKIQDPQATLSLANANSPPPSTRSQRTLKHDEDQSITIKDFWKPAEASSSRPVPRLDTSTGAYHQNQGRPPVVLERTNFTSAPSTIPLSPTRTMRQYSYFNNVPTASSSSPNAVSSFTYNRTTAISLPPLRPPQLKHTTSYTSSAPSPISPITPSMPSITSINSNSNPIPQTVSPSPSPPSIALANTMHITTKPSSTYTKGSGREDIRGLKRLLFKLGGGEVPVKKKVYAAYTPTVGYCEEEGGFDDQACPAPVVRFGRGW